MHATQHIVCGTSTKTISKHVPISCTYLRVCLPVCSSVCLSVCISTRNNLKTTKRIVIQFLTGEFYKNTSTCFKFGQNWLALMGTLHENLRITVCISKFNLDITNQVLNIKQMLLMFKRKVSEKINTFHAQYVSMKPLCFHDK